MKRSAPLRSKARLRARKPLRRKTWMRREAPRRVARRAHLGAHGAFVRTQPCCSCARPGPNEAAHMTLGRNEKGMGMKVADEQRVALCRVCHKAWDQHAGKFANWSDESRYSLGAIWVATTLARWEARQIEDLLAADEARVA